MACGGGLTLPEETPSFEGNVVVWDVPIPGGNGSFFMRVRAPDVAAECLHEIHVLPTTDFLSRGSDGMLAEATVSDLEIGRGVRIWTKVALDPCPSNGEARVVELLP